MPRVETQEVMKITFGGSAWDQQELWSLGIHLAMVDGGPIGTAFDDFDLGAAIGAWTSNMNVADVPSQSSSVSFDEVRLALFDTSNFTEQIGDSRVAFNTVNNAGIDTRPYLPQGSLSVTTNSDVLRGKTSKGRFYLPPGWYEIQPDGYVDPDVMVTTINQVAGFLDDLGDVAEAANSNLRLVNFSGYTTIDNATANEIIYFTLGNVVDTQRRRRNGLNERYSRGDLA